MYVQKTNLTFYIEFRFYKKTNYCRRQVNYLVYIYKEGFQEINFACSMKLIPVNLSSPVLPLISSCLVYWCTFVSGTFSPDPFSACLRTQPVSAFLSGASPACCLGRWTHLEPEVRGNLKQKAFWKFSCRYFFSF